MHNNITDTSELVGLPEIDLEADTARWTSAFYSIEFARISQIAPDDSDHDAFRMSAWGLSNGMSQLLRDYTDEQVKSAVDWLVIQQNAHVVMLLGDAMREFHFDFKLLDQMFITIDAELFLPRGLRMHVTCITNIVQVGTDSAELDKFVAVLDPGEASKYVQERRGMTVASPPKHVH
ncbi:MAG: hypothetical protein AAFV93_18570 [Chloroflexota bacterium]